MIILVGKEEKTAMSFVRNCKSKYPADSVNRFESFLVKDGVLSAEKTKEVPKRLTFVGHAMGDKFGKYTAEQFSDLLISQLREAAKLNPKIKNSIQTIDLVGCEVGLVRGENSESFADKVAKKLLELKNEGFGDIQVKAFSNLASPDPFPAHDMLVNLNDNKIRFYYYKEPEAEGIVNSLLEDIKKEEEKLEDINDEILKLRSYKSELSLASVQAEKKIQIAKIEKENLLKDLGETKLPKKISEIKEKINNINELLGVYKEVEIKIKKDFLEVQKRESELEAKEKNQLKNVDEAHRTYEKVLNSLIDKKVLCYIPPVEDIREALDKNIKYNFTKRATVNNFLKKTDKNESAFFKEGERPSGKTSPSTSPPSPSFKSH